MTATYVQSWAFWALLAGLALGTYALRASFILFVDRLGTLPPRLEAVLPYVPPAVLAALIAPAVLAPAGTLPPAADAPRLAGGAVGLVVAWRTESMLATVGAGMAAFWIVGAL